MRPLSIIRCCGTEAGLPAPILAPFCASTASPKQALTLDSFRRDGVLFSPVVSGFGTMLALGLGKSADFYTQKVNVPPVVKTKVRAHARYRRF